MFDRRWQRISGKIRPDSFPTNCSSVRVSRDCTFPIRAERYTVVLFSLWRKKWGCSCDHSVCSTKQECGMAKRIGGPERSKSLHWRNAKLLRESGIAVGDVSVSPAGPRCWDGRVKTCTPKARWAALRARTCRDQKQAGTWNRSHRICGGELLPFEATAAKTGRPPEEDDRKNRIGGPIMMHRQPRISRA